MTYCPYSIKIFRRLVNEKYSQAIAKKGIEDMPSHCLWIFKQLEQMPKGKSAKAGRWFSWVFGQLESTGLITNEDSRRMVRVDVKNGDK